MDGVKEYKKLIKYKPGKEYMATVQHMHSTTHIITYKGDFKESFFLKDFSPTLIKIFGESFISAVGEIPNYLRVIIWVFLNILLISVVDYCTFGKSFLFVFLLLMCGSIIAYLITVPLPLQYYYTAEYYRNTICNNCGNEFICHETERPDVKEISTPENYTIRITRYWSCRFCGYVNIRESSEGFVTRKEKTMKSSSLAKVQCKRCGKTGTYIEYKKPDVRVSKEDETMIRRYYRCKSCMYENIEASESFMVPDSAGISAVEWKIDYEDYSG